MTYAGGLASSIRSRSLVAAVVAVVFLGPVSNASASTLPGRNRQIAAVSLRAHSVGIGIATSRRTLRTVFSSTLGIFLSDLSFSPDGHRILYSEINGAPGASLAILNLDRGKAESIGVHGLHVSHPAFLSNGRIVFAGSHAEGRYPGTFESNSSGAHLHKLFAAKELAVSADGGSFIATDARGNFHTLYLLNRRGRRVRRLTTSPAFRYLRATFSPNGRWIAYEREIERPDKAPQSDLFVVRRDGTGRHRLTFGGDASDPAFSPNGRWIVYAHFNSGFGGNLAIVEVRHPVIHKAVTKVRRARFQSPTWAPR